MCASRNMCWRTVTENPFAEDEEFRIPGVWTPEEGAAGEKYVTRKEFAQYVAAMNQHGVMAVNSTEDSPHPEMSARSLRVGAGMMIANPSGVVFTGEPTGGLIHFVENQLISDDPASYEPRVYIAPSFAPAISSWQAALRIVAASTSTHAEVMVGSGAVPGDASIASLTEYDSSGGDKLAAIVVENSAPALQAYSAGVLTSTADLTTTRFASSVAMAIGTMTSDPTPADGWIWYRSDLDKYRVCANGVTYNLAVEAGPQILGDFSELTIASGVITVTTSAHKVDTEADAATDDLDTINGGTTGQILVLSAMNGGRTVVCKDNTGNLLLSADMTLDNTTDTLMLIYSGSNWYEIARSDNGA